MFPPKPFDQLESLNAFRFFIIQSRRQISTGTKFEVSQLYNVFVDFGQSGPSIGLVIKIISIITMKYYFGETTQQGAPWSFCDTTGYSFLSSWNEHS